MSTAIAAIVKLTSNAANEAQALVKNDKNNFNAPSNRKSDASLLADSPFSNVVINKCIFIEGLGGISRPASTSVMNIASHLAGRAQVLHKHRLGHYSNLDELGQSNFKVYSSIDEAINARIHTVTKHPGNQSISEEGARAIVERGVTQCKNNINFLHQYFARSPILCVETKKLTIFFQRRQRWL